jgi:hypothetical protein
MLERSRGDDTICAGRGGQGAWTVLLRALPGCIDSLRETAALHATGCNKARASRMLGISR